MLEIARKNHPSARRRIGMLLVAAAALGLSSLAAARAPDLPRRGWLGANIAPGATGVTLQSVIAGGSLATADVRTGDVLLAIDGQPVASVRDAALAVRGKRADAAIQFVVSRDGKMLDLHGRVRTAPLEHYASATVEYGSVASQGGQLRSILAMPRGVAAPPVVFFIQGYTCGSIEASNPQGEYANLAADFTAAGIGFYRVEKLGVGDSIGPKQCLDVDFATELQGFQDAYRDLVAHGVPEDRIYILGHSMGGIQAPLIAAQNHPRGVAVFGTVLRNWADYMLDLNRLQDFFLSDADPAESYARSERAREASYRFFFKREPMAKIVADYPAERENLTALMEWDGKTYTLGRSEVFQQDLATLNLAEAWKRTHACVLSLYGATDVVALTGQDQRQIAEMVNHYRPGTADYVEVPGTMHFMDLVGDRAALQANVRRHGLNSGPFNRAVPDAVIDWVKACGAKPVVP